MNIEIEYIEADGFPLYGHELTHIKTLPFLSVVTPFTGAYEISLNGSDSKRVLPGECFIAPPEVTQKIIHHQPQNGVMTAKWIFIKATIDGFLEFSRYFSIPMTLNKEKAAPLIKAIEGIFQLSDSVADKCEKYELAYHILKNIALVSTVSDLSDYEIISPALKLISDDLNQALTVPMMARTCSLSKSSFYKLFKATTGQTPQKYLREKRLTKACSLLLTTHLKLNDIAEQTGFFDEFHLGREFKKQYGKSPLRYKKDIENSYK